MALTSSSILSGSLSVLSREKIRVASAILPRSINQCGLRARQREQSDAVVLTTYFSGNMNSVARLSTGVVNWIPIYNRFSNLPRCEARTYGNQPQ